MSSAHNVSGRDVLSKTLQTRASARRHARRRDIGAFTVEAMERRVLLNAGGPVVQGAGGPIGFGEARTGEITAFAQTDTFSFRANAGDIIRIAVADTTPFLSPYSTVADLVNSNGDTLETITRGSEKQVTLLATGFYLIRVHDDNNTDTGYYAVGLDGIRPVSPDAGRIGYGETRDGLITDSAEVDTYTFNGAAGDIIRVALADTTPFLSPYNALAEIVRGDTGASVLLAGRGGELPFTLPVTGTYLIRLYDDNFTDGGYYAFGVDCLVPGNPDASPIPLGETREGTIATSAEVDTYTFTAAAGDLLRIAIADTTPFLSPYNNVVDVVNASGQILATLGRGAEHVFVPPAAGLYTLRVHDDNFTDGGVYVIGLDSLKPNPPDALPLTRGITYQGELTTSAEVDTYTFPGAAGEVVRIALADTTPFLSPFNAIAEVVSPAGAVLSTLTRGAQYSINLATTGTYTIRLHDDNFTDGGYYVFGLEGMKPVSPDALTLTAGAAQTGSLATSAAVQQLLFSAEANDRVRIALADTTPFLSPYSVVADLFGPAGNLVGTMQRGSQTQFTLPAAGTYLIQLHDDNFTDGGVYGIALDWLSPLDGSIAGRVFNDLDADGVADAGEPGARGFTLFLDADGDGTLDAGERQTVTDLLGNYAFTSVAPGTHNVRQVVPAGWTQTAPYGALRALDVGVVQSLANIDFATRSPVAGRYVFYNGSIYDGRNTEANSADDGAIVPTKVALLPGQLASTANYTNYLRGINGIMVDLPTLPAGVTLTADDFAFRAGPGLEAVDRPIWFTARTPLSVTTRPGAGANGTDRVTLIWSNPTTDDPFAPHRAITNAWLEVTIKPGGRTGLSVPDVFYFGNLIGDTFAPAADALETRVNSNDLGAVKATLNRAATIGGPADINRDGRVNSNDMGAVKANLNRRLALQDLTLADSARPAPAPVAASAVVAAARPRRRLAEELSLLTPECEGRSTGIVRSGATSPRPGSY